jgi:hypothetical protein
LGGEPFEVARRGQRVLQETKLKKMHDPNSKICTHWGLTDIVCRVDSAVLKLLNLVRDSEYVQLQ